MRSSDKSIRETKEVGSLAQKDPYSPFGQNRESRKLQTLYLHLRHRPRSVLEEPSWRMRHGLGPQLTRTCTSEFTSELRLLLHPFAPPIIYVVCPLRPHFYCLFERARLSLLFVRPFHVPPYFLAYVRPSYS